ncbi:MAG: tryptophan synthase alpha chain [Chloroflexi bacterium]|nr:MAG: tryptophan synthase alpha chain [Chloroflexota bacterium]
MPYLTGGYPTPAETVALIEALVQGGAGAIEVGVPFSDPLADGPTVQRANTAALLAGATLGGILAAVAELRRRGMTVPITLMGYLNPFLAYHPAGAARPDGALGGIAALAHDGAAAGVDGLIIVDLPPEESDAVRVALAAEEMSLIYLLAPTSTEARIQAVAERAAGFVYLVSVTGVTGARTELPPDLIDFVGRVRAAIELPLAVGFGISDAAQVATVGELCEAAVVGSAVISTVEQAPPGQRVASLRHFAEVMTGRGREQDA